MPEVREGPDFLSHPLAGNPLDDVLRGLRLMRRSPIFAGAVVLLLALGIGATTAIFSVAKAVLLTPLPYPEPGRIVMLWETEHRSNSVPASGPNFLDWQSDSESFDSLAALSPRPFGLSGSGEPARILGAETTTELFTVLGTQPEIGRTFLPEDGQPGSPPVAILGHGIWRRNFGATPDILGATLHLDGVAHTVIGVTPAGFDVATPWTAGQSMDIWTPLVLSSSIEERDSHSYLVLGRLADDVNLEQAQSELDHLAETLAASYPATNSGHGIRLSFLHEELLGRTGRQLMMLMAAATSVLLIVCANVGGLMLAKAASRKNELAVRLSLGAGRGQILLQLLVEHLPLAVLGGATGALLAAWALTAMRSIVPQAVAGSQDIGIDGWSLAFTMAFSLVATVLLGVAPALTATKTHLARLLNQGRRSFMSSPRGARTQRALVVGQLILCLVLAHAGALMITSYLKLQSTDHGFEAQGVVTAPIYFPPARYQSLGEVSAFLRDVLPGVGSLPGVQGAAATTKLPLDGGTNGRVVIEGREEDWDNERGPLAERSLVTPGYFQTIGIRLVAGRPLTEGDLESGAAVAVVNQSLAQTAWPEEEAIGKRFGLSAQSPRLTVVGVVADVRQFGPEYQAIPEYYVPISSNPAYWGDWEMGVGRVFLVLRNALPAQISLGVLKEEIWSVDSMQPVSDVRTMDQILSSANERRRFNTLLMSIFALLGLMLLAAGIFGMMSNFVTQRSHEIGVRIALGADTLRVLGLVLGYAGRLLVLGVAIGIAAALASSRLLEGLLYAVSPTDPTILVLGLFFVVLIGLLGAVTPALRATRIDPVVTLRGET